MKFLLLILALSGCADKEIVYTPVQVDKEIPIKCEVSQIQVPNFPSYQPSDSLFVKVKTLVSREKMRIAYESELVTANKACQ
jgi:hypothetical protein